MHVHFPSKRVVESFHLTYELKGAQKGVDVLTGYYKIQQMKIAVDGRRVTRGYDGVYFENAAFFTKKGLNKRNVLHELYHHIAANMGFEIPESKEEREADRFSNQMIKKEKTLFAK
jgi:hypothetical protein